MKPKSKTLKKVMSYIITEHGHEYTRYFVMCMADVLKNCGILIATYFGISYVFEAAESNIRYCAAGAALIFVSELSVLYLNRCMNQLNKSMEARVYKKVLEKTTKIPVLELTDSTTQNDINAALEEGKNALETITMDIPSYIGLILQICIFIAVVCRISWWYAPVTILLITITIVISSYFKSKELDGYDDITRQLRLLGYFSSLPYTECAHREMIIQNAAPYFTDRRKLYADQLIAEKRKKYRCHIKFSLYSGLILLLATISISAYLFYLLSIGMLKTELLATTLINSLLLYQQVLSLSEQFSWDKEALYYVDKYFKLLDMDEEQNIGYNKKIYDIAIHIDSFCYADKIILSNLELNLKQGQKILLIGDNGAGKTTLLNLLTGLYPLLNGCLHINNESCTTPIMVRNRSVIVSQNFPALKMTLRENLMCKNISEAEIQTALQAVDLWDEIQRLPDGLDTFVGEGHSLSQGQWQRFAIAKLLLHKEADIWVLDEPTSAMDAIHETDILKLVFDKGKDKIIIVVTHRLSMAKQMDHIYHITNGQIDFDGTHAELYASNSIYKNMFDIQAQMYV